MERLAREAGVEGRPLRAILAEMDGLAFLLAYHRKQLFVAETAEEAQGWTRHMEKQIKSQRERVERRQRYADRLPRAQGRLF